MNVYGKCLAWMFVLLLHSSVLWTCSHTLTQKAQAAQPPVAVHFIQEGRLLGLVDGTGLACKDTYRGIGLRTQWGSGEIIELAIQGPAEIAGIRLGDTLMNEEYYRQYPIGTHVLVRIERNKVQMEFDVIINDICYEQ